VRAERTVVKIFNLLVYPVTGRLYKVNLKCFVRPSSCLNLFKLIFFKSRRLFLSRYITLSTLAACWIDWDETCVSKGEETDTLQYLYILFTLCSRKHIISFQPDDVKDSCGISPSWNYSYIFLLWENFLLSPVADNVREVCSYALYFAAK
jgi:hypothetical protein